jgi:excisionase family DNA binding protein
MLSRVWDGLLAMSHFDEWLDRQPERMSVEQVADLLGVTGRTINNWLNEGRIPGYRTPGSWFVLREELRDYLRANRTRLSDTPIEDLNDD